VKSCESRRLAGSKGLSDWALSDSWDVVERNAVVTVLEFMVSPFSLVTDGANVNHSRPEITGKIMSNCRLSPATLLFLRNSARSLWIWQGPEGRFPAPFPDGMPVGVIAVARIGRVAVHLVHLREHIFD
jgi:hypothetical protein